MGKWVTDYIRDASKTLSRIATYRDKNIELYLQAQQDLLPYYLHSIIKTTLGTWRIISSSYKLLNIKMFLHISS